MRDRPGILKRLDDIFLFFLFSFCVFLGRGGGVSYDALWEF